MATIFDVSATARPVGDVRAGSVGGDYPWTFPIVKTYPDGLHGRDAGYIYALNGATGEEGPAFYFTDGDGFTYAARQAHAWLDDLLAERAAR